MLNNTLFFLNRYVHCQENEFELFDNQIKLYFYLRNHNFFVHNFINIKYHTNESKSRVKNLLQDTCYA